MKPLTILGMAIGLLFSINTHAQQEPQKGYYSIYNNAERLHKHKYVPANNNADTAPHVFPKKIAKGYYAIRPDLRPFASRNFDGIQSTQTLPGSKILAPRITKGYYSIGDNATKLPGIKQPLQVE